MTPIDGQATSRRIRRSVVGVAIALVVFGCDGADRAKDTGNGVIRTQGTVESRIFVDIDTRLQTMTGWEVTARLWEMDKARDAFDPSWEATAPQIFDRLVNDLGINRVRLEIRSGAENPTDQWRRFVSGEIGYREFKRHFYETVNDNDDPDVANLKGFQFSELDYRIEKIVLPMKRLVEANGEKLSVNLCYVDFGWTELRGSLEHALHPEEYAEFIHVTFQHMRDKYGLEPDALEIILEPDNTTHWKGREIGHALVAAVDRLEADGFSPDVIAPSTANPGAASVYFDEMIQIDGVLGRLDTFSYHRYGEFTNDHLRAINTRRHKNSLRTAMLEHLKSGVAELFEDLTIANASAWQQYGIAIDGRSRGEDWTDYYLGVDTRGASSRTVSLSTRSMALSQIFRFVRRGAVRVDVSSSSETRTAVAFVNPDGGSVVVVRVEDGGGPLFILGLAEGAYGARFVGERGEVVALGQHRLTGSDPLRVELPGAGVVTFYRLQSGNSQ